MNATRARARASVLVSPYKDVIGLYYAAGARAPGLNVPLFVGTVTFQKITAPHRCSGSIGSIDTRSATARQDIIRTLHYVAVVICNSRC